MSKGLKTTDSVPPKVRTSIEFPSGVNPYAHYGTLGYPGYPWGAPYVPYGRKSLKGRMSMALPDPDDDASSQSRVTSEDGESKKKQSAVASSKVSRPSTAIAPGVYPYHYAKRS